MAPMSSPPVVLFGYHSSAFTQKIRMVLKLRQIPYTFLIVPSMMPRPLLTSSFALTYRKIPIVAIGRDIYCDTSLQAEALNTHPALPPISDQHPSLHPLNILTQRPTRPLARLLGSHYTDRPWYRIMTGLVPAAVWRSSFGIDRAGLIGHKLDADKLERKIPTNLASLERDLSILEPWFSAERWMLPTAVPGAVDINLYFMLNWGRNIAKGVGVENLTGGEVEEMGLEGMDGVFNQTRFPGVWRWFWEVREYFDALPNVEEDVVEKQDQAGVERVLQHLSGWEDSKGDIPTLPTPQPWNAELDALAGIAVGTEVSVAPDDTGKDNPVRGTVLKLTAEEVVISPAELETGKRPTVGGVRVHFPRLGFVVRPLGKESKL